MTPQTKQITTVPPSAFKPAAAALTPEHTAELVKLASLPSAESALPPQIPPGLSFKRRTRLGKIARLPKPLRDMVNRMLRNNLPYPQIVGALDEVGITVTQRNVSNWKTRGGYAEWCLEQDHALEIRLLQDNLLQFLRTDDASQLPEVGLQLAATHLSRFLLQPEALHQIASAPEKYARLLSTLCRLSSQIHTLQKYRDDCAKELGLKHYPERVRRDNQQELEQVRNAFSSTIPDKSSDPAIPHRNFIPDTWP